MTYFVDDEPVASTSKKRDDQDVNDHYGAIASGSEESDDEDNFIVDDDDQPISKPRRKKGAHRYDNEAMQSAQDIFGVEFDFEDLNEEEYDDEADEDDYEEDGEEGERPTRRKKSNKRKPVRKNLQDIYEPCELERSHLTEVDNEIKVADLPERFLLRGVPVIPTEDETLIDDESEWIFKQCFSNPTLTKQHKELGVEECAPIAGAKDGSAVLKIREALKFIRKDTLEVPFIAFYRKEYVHPDLNIDDLWAVYKYDEKFCQLQHRKQKMLQLFKSMYKYRNGQIVSNPALINTEMLVTEEDIDRVNQVETFDELHDLWVHFQLYHSAEVPAMRAEQARNEREKKRIARQAAAEENGSEQPAPSFDVDDDAEMMSRMSLKLKRKDVYTMLKDAGLLGMTKMFGMTPEQLGENIQNDYQKHEVTPQQSNPLEYAIHYVNPRLPKPEDVLSATRHMIAKEISCNPVIRKCVRQAFHEIGVVQVKPTKKGLKERMDESHPCYKQLYLKDKPIREFIGDSFLQLQIAEKDGTLDVKITVDKIDEPGKYIQKIAGLYTQDGFSDNIKKWNEERNQVLDIAFNKYLFPALEKEFKAKMRQEGIDAIIKQCASKLNEQIRVAPYKPDTQITDDEDFDVRDGVRVMGFAFLPETDQAAFAAVIDGDGEVTDHLRLPNFMLRKSDFAPKSEQALREKDHQRLKSFILSKKPHVIVVGSECIDARNVHKNITEVVQDLCDNDQFPPIRVEIIDNELSSVYMNSIRGKADFHDYPDLLRQAVSLARRIQDPLVEFSQLCTPEEEILCLRYHPLQDQLPKEDLLNALNTIFINTVNEVGVDINRAIVHPHTAQLVQFICGLGPRKASALLRTLKKQQTPILESRTQLIMNCKFGAKVFINCAGFIKIDTAQLTDTGTDTYIEVLDSTRVHPEAYEWARKMAVDALEYDDENDAEANPAGALDEILDNPDKLKDLDLDAFAEELERQGFGNKSITLYDIRNELTNRYKDMRMTFRSPCEDTEVLFKLLTKETPETLYIGKLITGTVTKIYRVKADQERLDSANPIRDEETNLWKCPFCSKNDFSELSDVWVHFDAKSCEGEAKGVNVRLDNGINGFIKTDKLSDKAVTDPSERVQPGMTIHARVLRITPEKFSVDLTCRSSDLNDVGFEYRPTKDEFYNHGAEKEYEEEEAHSKKKHQRPTYIKRIIVHPSFHNIDFKKAEHMMLTMEQGEAIIRPSSKGEDHLTLTWKVHAGIVQHVDIIEKNKDNAFSIGSQLFIKNESYEDLDEIIARFVQPMASLARDVASFKYFRYAEGGKKEVLTKLLEDEKRKQPAKIHYFASICKELPGKLLLSYLPRNKVCLVCFCKPNLTFFYFRLFTNMSA